MTLFSSFAVSLGSLLALIALIAAWLFRTASAPLWAKVAIPSLAVALGCYAPFSVSSMMGFPVPVGFDALPDRAELVAFVPRDEERRVDLWLRAGRDAPPRAYETALSAEMKKTLRQAAKAMGHGQPAMLTKHPGPRAGAGHGRDALAIGADDQTMYVLDPSAMGLPPKE